MNLWDALTRHTEKRDVWAWNGESFYLTSWEELVQSARRAGHAFRQRGLRRGSIVPAILTNGPAVAPATMGAWFAGATVASLPIIARGMSIPSYTEQLSRICRLLDASVLLIEDRFLKLMPDDIDLGVELLSFDSLIETASSLREIDPSAPDDTFFVQFSSGTTAEPRGVKLSVGAVEKHMGALMERLEIDSARDVGCSWLPQSHDMGFFGGTLQAWYAGMSGVLSWPERFLQSPHTWFDDCSRFGVTITGASPSALGMAARAQKVRGGNGPLSIRNCMVGAEQISWDVLENAVNAFAGRGLTRAALTAAYGMAETTLAVTMGNLASEPSFIDVDAQTLERQQQVIRVHPDDPSRRRLVSCGSCLPGVTVRSDGELGELIIRSPSLSTGYIGDDEATKRRFADGEFRTSDIGFVVEGNVYVVGRIDDCIIVGGRNIYVQDAEQQLAVHALIRKGNCAIVEAPRGSGQIGLVAEVTPESFHPTILALKLRAATLERGGPPITDFAFVPHGTFPKTPSGKAQRYRCREILAKQVLGNHARLRAPVGHRNSR